MNVPRSTLIYTAVWVGVVIVCSTLVWAVISRAGEGVTSDEPPARGASTSTPRNPGTTSTGPTISPSTSPPTSRAPTPGSPSTSTDPPVAAPVQRTWSGMAGVVVVECRGVIAGFVSARPNDGFGAEVDDAGPNRVEVEFEGHGDSDARTRVRAECVGGEPVFEVDPD